MHGGLVEGFGIAVAPVVAHVYLSHVTKLDFQVPREVGKVWDDAM